MTRSPTWSSCCVGTADELASHALRVIPALGLSPAHERVVTARAETFLDAALGGQATTSDTRLVDAALGVGGVEVLERLQSGAHVPGRQAGGALAVVPGVRLVVNVTRRQEAPPSSNGAGCPGSTLARVAADRTSGDRCEQRRSGGGVDGDGRRLVSSGSPLEGPVGSSRALWIGSMVWVAGITADRRRRGRRGRRLRAGPRAAAPDRQRAARGRRPGGGRGSYPDLHHRRPLVGRGGPRPRRGVRPGPPGLDDGRGQRVDRPRPAGRDRGRRGGHVPRALAPGRGIRRAGCASAVPGPPSGRSRGPGCTAPARAPARWRRGERRRPAARTVER